MPYSIERGVICVLGLSYSVLYVQKWDGNSGGDYKISTSNSIIEIEIVGKGPKINK
jgi:hypothetical protein